MKSLFLGTLSLTLSSFVNATNGTSLDISVGQAQQETSFDEVTTSNQKTSFGIRGGFNLIDNLNAELSFNNYQTSEGSYIDDDQTEQTASVKTTAIDLGLKYGVNITDHWAVYAHVGISSLKMDVRKNVTSTEVEETESEESESEKTTVEKNSLDDQGTYYALSINYDHNDKDAYGVEYKVIDTSAELENAPIKNKIQNLSIYFKTKF